MKPEALGLNKLTDRTRTATGHVLAGTSNDAAPRRLKGKIEAMPTGNSRTVSIGLRAKTGRAIAVVLGGRLDAPRILKRVELTIADPAFPETLQPYHEVLDLPWDKAQEAVRKIASRIEKMASREIERLVREAQTKGAIVTGVGIVGAGDRNLERIASTHIRAHAAEGVLFRAVLEAGAAANALPNRRFDERVLDQIAQSELKLSIARIKGQLAEMGRVAGRPWRTDEKAAATAAWVVLANSGLA